MPSVNRNGHSRMIREYFLSQIRREMNTPIKIIVRKLINFEVYTAVCQEWQ